MINLRSPQPATARAMCAVTALTLAAATLTVTAAPAWADTVLVLPAATNAATANDAMMSDPRNSRPRSSRHAATKINTYVARKLALES